MLIAFIIFFFLALGVSAICSLTESGFLSLTRAEIARLTERGRWSGPSLDGLKKNVDRPLAAILTLNTVAHTLGATMAGAQAAAVFGSAWVGLFSGILTFLSWSHPRSFPRPWARSTPSGSPDSWAGPCAT